MIIYPNIELQKGKCVNLFYGLMDKPTVYDIDPVVAAKKFAAEGAEWLHVVDHDAVGKLENDNHKVVLDIIDAVTIPVQVGGGIRTATSIDWWLEHGAARVVVGNMAVVDPGTVRDACSRHPYNIAISIDASQGMVVSDGRTNQTAFMPLEFARYFDNDMVGAIIFTDIDRDVELPESSLGLTTEIAAGVGTPLIVSGTVKTLDDISTLKYLPNIAGAITGRALFTGEMDLTEAIEIARA